MAKRAGVQHGAPRMHLQIPLTADEQNTFRLLALESARNPSQFAAFLIRRVLLDPRTNAQHAARGDLLHEDVTVQA